MLYESGKIMLQYLIEIFPLIIEQKYKTELK